MNHAHLFDTFSTLFAIGLSISVGTLVTFLALDTFDKQRSRLPRATARLRPDPSARS